MGVPGALETAGRLPGRHEKSFGTKIKKSEAVPEC